MYDIGSPAAKRLALPRWLNARLALGVLLILVSTVVGTKLIAGADTTTRVWVASRALPAGYQLSGSDFSVVRVHLGDTGRRYASADAPAPAGYVLNRPLEDGELVPSAALVLPGQARPERRNVAVPVRAGHYPNELRQGDLVDVYVTVKRSPDGTSTPSTSASPSAAATAAASGSGEPAPPTAVANTRLVLAGVPVQAVPHSGSGVFAGSDSSSAVSLSVPGDGVVALVASIESGDVDLVRVAAAAKSQPDGGVPSPAPTVTATP